MWWELLWRSTRRWELGSPEEESGYETGLLRAGDAYLRIPGDTGGVPLLDVLLQRVDQCDKPLCPSDRRGVSVDSSELVLHCSDLDGLQRIPPTHVSLNCLITRSAQNCAAFFISPTYGAGAGSYLSLSSAPHDTPRRSSPPGPSPTR